MEKKEVIYISGPYRSDSINGIYENIQRARTEAIKWWKKGNYAVICPHLNSFLMDGACHDDAWIEGDLELVRRSDIIVMLPGWEQSEGAVREYNEAIKSELYIKEIDNDTK
jgi:hypothetical protein